MKMYNDDNYIGAPVMGSWLSDKLKNLKKSLPAGNYGITTPGGVLNITKNATGTAITTGQPPTSPASGIMDFIKSNPLVIAGIAAAALLIFLKMKKR